jgi:hypothetical protein
MIGWMAIHWTDVLLHLGLDLSGGFSLRCAMGMCDHKHHQYIAWGVGSMLLSISTVALVG